MQRSEAIMPSQRELSTAGHHAWYEITAAWPGAWFAPRTAQDEDGRSSRHADFDAQRAACRLIRRIHTDLPCGDHSRTVCPKQTIIAA